MNGLIYDVLVKGVLPLAIVAVLGYYARKYFEAEKAIMKRVFGEKRTRSRRLKKIALTVSASLIFSAAAVVTWYFYFQSSSSLTILMRMMEHQEIWFQENIIKEFEKQNRSKVILKRFGKDYELVEILRKESEVREIGNVSLAKIPFHLTLLLYKQGLVKPYEDILSDLKLNKHEINSRLKKIQDEFDPVAINFSKFSTITGEKLYFLPRKLDIRLMIYRKSKVVDAVKNWHNHKNQINAVLMKENGYGLPKQYNLESDVNQWDSYDLFVLGYYWAVTEYNGEKTGRIAHRSENYSGTVVGLIDRALQLGASKEDICNMNKSPDAIIDMLHWESIFRKYNLYSEGMWQEDGWSGYDIIKVIKDAKVYLAWTHQLDCMLIYGSEHLEIKDSLTEKKDLGVSIMPQGVSFELTKDGLPERTGSREAHTSGWFWGIPKNSPQPELAYNLSMFITNYASQLEECKIFYIFPVRKRVCEVLTEDLKAGWQNVVYAKSVEQFKINGHHCMPRFQTLTDYKNFLDYYYEAFEQIVIKKGYSPTGSEDRIDRGFIRQYLEERDYGSFCG